MTHVEAGRLGGISVREKYGVDYLREMGRRNGARGGRPTFAVSLARAQAKSEKNREELRQADGRYQRFHNGQGRDVLGEEKQKRSELPAQSVSVEPVSARKGA